MFKQCLTIFMVGIMLAFSSTPAFASTNNEQITENEQMKLDFRKAIPDAGVIEKIEKINLVPENKDRLLSITGDKTFVDNLYKKELDSIGISSVIYSTYWVQGTDGSSSCKYKQDVVLDGNYRQSRITKIYEESLDITVFNGHYSIVTMPKILDYQQLDSNPARSYCKYQLQVNSPALSFTRTLTGYVRDTSTWTTFN